ncbi:MAG: heme-binding domain-containing protein, partial [Verrucomicrobiota bacterium]
DGIDEDLDQLIWKRYAAGLHQALGLVVHDSKVVVLGRDQITRLVDVNGDDEADYYQCLTNEFPTKPGNSYACTLHQDEDGTLYWFTRSEGFGFTRFREEDKPQSIATGLRGTNGTGVSPDGQILLSTVQEGDWTPASAIFEVGGGSFHGHKGPQDGRGQYGYDLPMCFIPRGLDNSSGDIAFLPEDDRFGPLSGCILGTSLGACLHYKILREDINGRSQGGIVPLAGDFLSGAHRSRYNPHDGQFYVGGSHGWESYAQEDGSLQRVRYNGGDLHLPTSVETRENGLIVRFNTKIDPSTVKAENAFCEQWNYLYSSAYGSAEYSVKKPSRIGHDAVEVNSVQLLESGDAVFVEIQQLHPVMQLHLYLDLKTADGKSFTPDLYYSIFELGEAFTDFPGYQKVEKSDFPDFPAPEDAPRDPRLVAQERLGKSTGEFETAVISCVPGLQFEPRRIQMRAGRRASLVLKNVDVEMPHNFVLVQPDRIEEVGQASMKLAADPKAVAIHYVPNDPAVIAMSPLIGPGEQYAIYFNTPREPGEYPFLCTFPGHWLIMRGALVVTEDEVPTPF